VSGALVPRLGGSVERSGRTPRPVVQAVRLVRGEAVVEAARVSGAAFVTHTALELAAQLSGEEARLLAVCPLGEARYRLIVDQYAATAATLVARWGW